MAQVVATKSWSLFLDLFKALKILKIRSYHQPEDLKKAFHQLAHQYHPDKNHDRDTTQDFRNLLHAYQFCLEHLDDLSRYFDVQINSYHEKETIQKQIENLDDIFSDIFGFSHSGRVLGYVEPQDVFFHLQDFLFGGEKVLKLIAYENCSDCSGSGAEKGTIARICRYCFGKGYIVKKGNTQNFEKICPQCEGRGREIERPCLKCQGMGRTPIHKKQKLHIPLGLQPDEKYTLTAYDLDSTKQREVHIRARFLGHSIFQIENYDLICEYHMDFRKHQKDQDISLETPFGPRVIRIPGTARPNQVLTLSEGGLFKNAQKTERGQLKIKLKQKSESWFKRLWGRMT